VVELNCRLQFKCIRVIAGNEYGAIEVTLDGRVNIIKDSLYSYRTGIFKADVDGWMVLLEPSAWKNDSLLIRAK
jgi:hypothetical protein